MRRWLYVAGEERVYLEPVPRVYSPGDVMCAAANPDPARFVEL
jgi:hypothetical protein